MINRDGQDHKQYIEVGGLLIFNLSFYELLILNNSDREISIILVL